MRRSPNRILATVFGIVYILIGVAGFFVTSGVGFFDTTGGLLLGIFEVNILHNVAHVLIGAALLLAGVSGVRASKTMNAVIGAAYLALGLIGLFVVGSPFNILAINGADNVLHFGSAVLLLAVGLGAERGGKAEAADAR
jgi:hypothetical protein